MRSLVLFTLIALASCAAETATTNIPCMTPAGTYKVELKAANGTCSQEFQKAFIESASGTNTKVSEACYTKSASTADTIVAEGTGVSCNVTTASSIFGTNVEYGGTLAVSVSCEDGSSCQHSFTVHYTKQ